MGTPKNQFEERCREVAYEELSDSDYIFKMEMLKADFRVRTGVHASVKVEIKYAGLQTMGQRQTQRISTGIDMEFEYAPANGEI